LIGLLGVGPENIDDIFDEDIPGAGSVVDNVEPLHVIVVRRVSPQENLS